MKFMETSTVNENVMNGSKISLNLLVLGIIAGLVFLVPGILLYTSIQREKSAAIETEATVYRHDAVTGLEGHWFFVLTAEIEFENVVIKVFFHSGTGSTRNPQAIGTTRTVWIIKDSLNLILDRNGDINQDAWHSARIVTPRGDFMWWPVDSGFSMAILIIGAVIMFAGAAQRIVFRLYRCKAEVLED